jgi:hypothetical protein
MPIERAAGADDATGLAHLEGRVVMSAKNQGLLSTAVVAASLMLGACAASVDEDDSESATITTAPSIEEEATGSFERTPGVAPPPGREDRAVRGREEEERPPIANPWEYDYDRPNPLYRLRHPYWRGYPYYRRCVPVWGCW